MELYIKELFEDKLSGIPLSAWQYFLKIFSEGQSASGLDTGLQRLASAFAATALSAAKQQLIRDKFDELAALLKGDQA